MGRNSFFVRLVMPLKIIIDPNDCGSPRTADWYESIWFCTINETLARLTKIGEIKNKSSNNRHCYYLIDNSADVTDT